MDIASQKKAVEHLAFEVYHFRCYRRLDNNRQMAGIISQAVRYSLLLHVRVLLGFFSASPWPDDCSMGDFITDTNTRKKLTPSAEAKAIILDLHKRLAHFTRIRWETVPAPTMAYYAKYFDEIERLINGFQAALPADIRRIFTNKLDSFAKSEPCDP